MPTSLPTIVPISQPTRLPTPAPTVVNAYLDGRVVSLDATVAQVFGLCAPPACDIAIHGGTHRFNQTLEVGAGQHVALAPMSGGAPVAAPVVEPDAWRAYVDAQLRTYDAIGVTFFDEAHELYPEDA